MDSEQLLLNLNTRMAESAEALCNTFDWSDTPEEHTYWSRIYSRLYDYGYPDGQIIKW